MAISLLNEIVAHTNKSMLCTDAQIENDTTIECMSVQSIRFDKKRVILFCVSSV